VSLLIAPVNVGDPEDPHAQHHWPGTVRVLVGRTVQVGIPTASKVFPGDLVFEVRFEGSVLPFDDTHPRPVNPPVRIANTQGDVLELGSEEAHRYGLRLRCQALRPDRIVARGEPLQPEMPDARKLMYQDDDWHRETDWMRRGPDELGEY